ncbi:MFS transporter [Saccharobesus litoralis]|uniref:MFS transporter n=1 Tax=Saccharobesus litoralis TaxID=2172099 RepID=A0A2S0VMV8_9ALTE|nr:VC0807 family protein [Saccharobesus litoralis]AWB65561.1 MFS transporter [Saccharobesus litoralis]
MQKQNNPLLELIFNIVVPSVILMKFSGEDALGPVNGLIVALAFPLIYGVFELIKYKKYNFFSILGFVSVLMTGGIGLLELDNQWLAVKEALVPGLIGLVVWISGLLGKPLVSKLLINDTVMKTDMVYEQLKHNNSEQAFTHSLARANYFFAGTFAFSAVVNYFLATYIVTSPSGTPEFNEELGQLTIWSYPMIVIPSMLMMFAIMYFIWKSINKHTQLSFEQVFNTQ